MSDSEDTHEEIIISHSLLDSSLVLLKCDLNGAISPHKSKPEICDKGGDTIKRQRVSELIAHLQSYQDQTGDDEVEFAFGCEELKVIKIHEAYEGNNERYCEITLDDIDSEEGLS